MRRVLAALIVLVCWVNSVSASVTITNYNGSGTTKDQQIERYDVAGNNIDAHEGQIVQFGSTFYWYGEHWSCGFIVSNTTAWCGFRVYTSSDLLNWTDQGYLFDGSISYWQTRCALPNANGCWRPKMMFNAANNNYVLWFNQFQGSAADNEFVMTCASPLGGCTPAADPTGVAHPPVGDASVFVDPASGNGYLIYSNQITREVWIDLLNASFTDSAGTTVDTGGNGEAVYLFENSGTYYAGYGSLCPNCAAGSSTSVRSASSVLGAYGSATQLNANGCNSQAINVAKISAGGFDTYVYVGDQFSGQPNIGVTNYYWQPLTFTGSAVDTFSCNATVNIPGVTSTGTYPTPTFIGPTVDQTDVQIGAFQDRCDITDSVWRFQTFVPSVAALHSIASPIGQNTGTCTYGAACSGPDGNLEIDLVTVSGNVPAATLASVTISPSALQWSTQWTRAILNQTLSPGTTYGFVVKGVGMSQGCFVNSISLANSAYPSGIERYSTDAGSTWTTDANASLMFSTFAPDPSQGPGRHFR